MTLYDALNQMKNGQAAKTAQMLGYVKRVDAVKGSEDTWKSKYDITFVERTGNVDNDNVTSYRFTHTIASDGTLTVTGPYSGESGTTGTSLNLDAMLYRMIWRSDWTLVTVADAEAARNGTGSRW